MTDSSPPLPRDARRAWLDSVPDADRADEMAAWLALGLPLWEDDVWQMGNALKDAAHAALYEAFERCVRLAGGLIALGEGAGEARLVALGEMALGDAYRLQSQYEQGYALLERAAARFEAAGDEVGWARTRIGWLGSIQFVGEPPTLNATVERAASIFERHGGWHWLATLCSNYAYYWYFLGDPHRQLAWCERAHRALSQLEGEEPPFYATALVQGMMIDAYNDLGWYDRAQRALDEAASLFKGREHITRLYVDFLLQAGRLNVNTGRYAQALFYLYEAQRRAPPNLFPDLLKNTDLYIARAFFQLGRHEEAETLLRAVLARAPSHSAVYRIEAEARIQLADLLATQERWAEALEVLGPAIQLLEALPTKQQSWLSQAYQQQARLLHRSGQQLTEQAAAEEAALRWAEASQSRWQLAHTWLLLAELADTPQRAEETLGRALETSSDLPWIRWRVHRTAARHAATPRERRTQLVRAAADLDTVQSTLAASFHANFLGEVQTLYDDLIGAHLAAGDIPLAWQTLERAKSRALVNTMLAQDEEVVPTASPLLSDLESLRLRHYALLKRAAPAAEIRAIERAISEAQEAVEVSLLGRREPLRVPEPFVPEAPDHSDLVAFYLTPQQVHAFVHDGGHYHHVRLAATPDQVGSLATALGVTMRATPIAPDSWIPQLTSRAHGLLAQLDALLLAPLRPWLRHERVTIVPHGLLHQMPFHLLRHEERYLLQDKEVRVMPTARLLLPAGAPRQAPPSPRSVVIAHGWEGRLPSARLEGAMIAEILGNTTIIQGEDATRERLRAAMEQATLLHIAAHGAHRPDAPQLSFIQLEDGQLCVGDLFRVALSASLVTLSACDSGQLVVRAGDDPVGLARGFLAAGARSLLVSLWQLEDGCALRQMGEFYRRLAAGANKVAALRAVQCDWLASETGRLRHPFYWGALQLLGDDGPLPV